MIDGGSERQKPSDVKAALLAARLRGQRLPEADPAAIGARPGGTLDLAAFGQERLWFLQQLNPTSAAYNMYQVIRLRGSLNAVKLGQVLDTLVARHRSLRTALRLEAGKLVQVAAENISAGLTVEDLPGDDPAARLAAARGRAVKLARMPFALDQAPLLRAALLRLGPDDHIFVLVVHHCAADEWSFDVLWRELAALYVGQGGEVVARPLPELTVQYADFAHWQRSRWARGDFAPQLAYWQQQLGDGPPILQLPTDFPRPPVQRFRGAICRHALPNELRAALQAVARAGDASLFMLIAAVFDVLLFRWTGQRDILIGTPIANRTRPELESVVGFFLNTVVLRTQMEPHQSFRALLAAVRDVVLGAFANQDLPFERLVDELKLPRDPSYNPLFQVMLVFQTHRRAQAAPAGLALELLPLDYGAAKFDLTLFAVESEQGLELALEYNTDLFAAATIERMLAQLGVLMGGIAAAPDSPVARLPLLPPAEVATLQAWNETSAPFPMDARIHDLIAAQAVRTPDSPAVREGATVLTYCALEEQAERLARRLRAHGVGPGVLVPICGERSGDLIAGILGILKAGGAYVPLDPSYPRGRLAGMVADIVRNAPRGCPVMLGARTLAAELAEYGVPVLALEDGVSGDEWAAPEHAREATAADLAYVIFTSGSTGRPKGVMVTHRNLVNSTTARMAVYSREPARFLLLSSFAFDSSLVGIFWTLCRGGTLVLPPARIEQDMVELAGLVERQAITHLLCLPSLYELLLTYAGPDTLRTLQTTIVAGEACPRRVALRHLARLPGTQLYNEYGPTEATIWCTAYAVPSELPPGPVAIGRPIPNLHVYVLDSAGQPVPIGAAGELYVGGAGVAAGYLGQPQMTAERFDADDRDTPDAAQPGPRRYRTGDLVRYRADGNLLYLGRTDQQVKIRGYRIELEEIERILLSQPGIREAAVVLRTGAAPASAYENPQAELDNEWAAAQLARLKPQVRAALLAEVNGLTGEEIQQTAAVEGSR